MDNSRYTTGFLAGAFNWNESEPMPQETNGVCGESLITSMLMMLLIVLRSLMSTHRRKCVLAS